MNERLLIVASLMGKSQALALAFSSRTKNFVGAWDANQGAWDDDLTSWGSGYTMVIRCVYWRLHEEDRIPFLPQNGKVIGLGCVQGTNSQATICGGQNRKIGPKTTTSSGCTKCCPNTSNPRKGTETRSAFSLKVGSSDGPNTSNPRKGTETLLSPPINIYSILCPNTSNPRKGTETN